MNPADPPGKAYSGIGIARLGRALVVSLNGLRAAFRSEAAFRQELLLVLVLVVVALLLDLSGLERAVLIGSAVLILIVELLNSAIEHTLDRISTDHHALTGAAKDIGSAAVFLSIVEMAIVWTCVLVPKIF